MKQNITLSLDEELIRKLNILSAQKSTSLSVLLSEQLSRLIQKNDVYQQSMKKAFASMERGFDFGGKYPARTKLYGRSGENDGL